MASGNMNDSGYKRSGKIILHCIEGDIKFETDEIILIETGNHRCIIHLSDKEYHIYESLANMEIILRVYGFLRIHQSYLVNMLYVRSINSYILTFDNGDQLPVSKARYKEIKGEYLKYSGKKGTVS